MKKQGSERWFAPRQLPRSKGATYMYKLEQNHSDVLFENDWQEVPDSRESIGWIAIDVCIAYNAAHKCPVRVIDIGDNTIVYELNRYGKRTDCCNHQKV